MFSNQPSAGDKARQWLFTVRFTQTKSLPRDEQRTRRPFSQSAAVVVALRENFQKIPSPRKQASDESGLSPEPHDISRLKLVERILRVRLNGEHPLGLEIDHGAAALSL